MLKLFNTEKKSDRVKESKGNKKKVKTLKETHPSPVKSIGKKISLKFLNMKRVKNTQIQEQQLKQGKFMLFSLRNKIYVCFLLPIIFMVVVGFISYRFAADGMSSKFHESTLQAANMAVEYLDNSCTYIQTDAFKYAFGNDTDSTYFYGMMKKDPIVETQYFNNTRYDLMVAQTANSFIGNIYFVTKKGVPIISTITNLKYDGIYDEYYADMLSKSPDGRNIPKWIDSHSMLDETLELEGNDFYIAYQIRSTEKFAFIVIDIKKESFIEILNRMNSGVGSINAFITSNGKELICENIKEGQESALIEGEPIFTNQEFYNNCLASEESSGSSEVTFQGKRYLYVYSKSTISDITLCTLIPMSIVTMQADKIRSITIAFVIIATVLAAFVGTIITMGIGRNMKMISTRLNQFASGDLTVQVHAHGRDEFQLLAQTATSMIQNNRKLVTQVTSSVGQMELSTKNVNDASGSINNYSSEITQAIDEISEGMQKQAEHAQECVVRTSGLSDRIQEISIMVNVVEKLVDATEKMIRKGTEIVGVLGERAKETSEMTAKVGACIEVLSAESDTIDDFVETINHISSKTNLLSLNASIEAARAGAAGRGFSVVAEEIRKLADDSGKAAGEIKYNVANINAQTLSSAKSAKEAEEMVALQTKAVDEVTLLFQNMSDQMADLFVGLKKIATNTEEADKERNDTLDAVENISAIIQETASGSALVREMAQRLLDSVEKLSQTADVLEQNMKGLKVEVSEFKLS